MKLDESGADNKISRRELLLRYGPLAAFLTIGGGIAINSIISDTKGKTELAIDAGNDQNHTKTPDSANSNDFESKETANIPVIELQGDKSEAVPSFKLSKEKPLLAKPNFAASPAGKAEMLKVGMGFTQVIDSEVLPQLIPLLLNKKIEGWQRMILLVDSFFSTLTNTAKSQFPLAAKDTEDFLAKNPTFYEKFEYMNRYFAAVGYIVYPVSVSGYIDVIDIFKIENESTMTIDGKQKIPLIALGKGRFQDDYERLGYKITLFAATDGGRAYTFPHETKRLADNYFDEIKTKGLVNSAQKPKAADSLGKDFTIHESVHVMIAKRFPNVSFHPLKVINEKITCQVGQNEYEISPPEGKIAMVMLEELTAVGAQIAHAKDKLSIFTYINKDMKTSYSLVKPIILLAILQASPRCGLGDQLKQELSTNGKLSNPNKLFELVKTYFNQENVQQVGTLMYQLGVDLMKKAK